MNGTAPSNVHVDSAIAARVAGWSAWIVWLLAVMAAILGLLLGFREHATGRSVVTQSDLSAPAGVTVALAFASVGLLLRVRRPDIVIGWLFLGIGAVASLANTAWEYALLAAAQGSDPGPISAAELAWIANLIQVPLWFVLVIRLVLLFPDGRVPGHRWSSVLTGANVVAGLLAACLAVAPGYLQFFSFVPNPHALTGAAGDVVLLGAVVSLLALTGFGLAAAWSVVLRFRHGTAVARQQLKWFAWAAGLAIAAGVAEIVLAGAAFGPTGAAADLGWLIFCAAATTVPAAALIAILRYRLYDIDRLIGRTFVYGALTAIVAGLYAASIRLFTALFVGLSGETSDTALVLTTLVLATTFTPIKGRLEAIAGRRYRDHGAATASSPVLSPEAADPDLDRRIEEIAARVARDILAGRQPDRGETVDN